MRVAAIILAAGASSRLGKPKQLLELNGETLLRRAARSAFEAGCSPVVVVLGAEAECLRDELTGLSVSVVVNGDWKEGISSSIRAGLAHVNAERILLLSCDQPRVDGPALKRLVDLGLTSGKPIVASAYADTLGVPALFDRSLFGELLQLRGDEGAKRIILAQPERVARFAFPAAAIDIDTPADLRSL